MSEISKKYWDRDTALAQIEKCAFECEGGPLENNVAWTWLKKALEAGPKYLPGQGVFCLIETVKHGVKLSGRAHFYVVGVYMTSDTERRHWVYALSNDPPGPYHYGEVQMTDVKESMLSLTNEAA